ncbi:MAG TPA: hypothetical protein VIT85_06435 [Solirubrobacterales bacterium]
MSVCLLLAAASWGTAAAPDSGCTAKETRAALVSFTRAYSRGDLDRLDSLFAEEPRFEWYSTDGPGRRIGPPSRVRDTLIPYFEHRHRKHDRMTLASFGFNGNSPRYGNFEMRLRRRADGFRGGDWFRVWGKGALVCPGDDARFIVISLGTIPAG